MFTSSSPSPSSHPLRPGYTLPGFVSFGASVLPSLDMRAENGLSLPHNNAIYSLFCHSAIGSLIKFAHR